jgi:hypothetical protein
MTITDYLVNISSLLGCKFQLFGKNLNADKVFAADGLLPPFVKRADNLSNFILKKPIGAHYQKHPAGLSGLKVSFDDTVPNSYRILCLTDVLIELFQTQSVESIIKLDELLYD